MLYLDDLAVWVRTQKGSILRGIMCLIAIFAIVIIFWKGLSKKPALENQIKEYDTQITKLDYDIGERNKEIQGTADDSISAKDSYQFKAGNNIAELQSQYGQFEYVNDLANLNERYKAIKENLTQYVMSGENIDNWYEHLKGGYTWRYTNPLPYVIDKSDIIDVLFTCKKDNSPVLAVATGKVRAREDKVYDINVYLTYAGQQFQTNIDSSISGPGSLFTSMDDETFYRKYLSGMPLEDEVEEIPDDAEMGETPDRIDNPNSSILDEVIQDRDTAEQSMNPENPENPEYENPEMQDDTGDSGNETDPDLIDSIINGN